MPTAYSDLPFLRRPVVPGCPDSAEARIARGGLGVVAGLSVGLLVDAVLVHLVGLRLALDVRRELVFACVVPVAFVVRHWTEREAGPLRRTVVAASIAGVAFVAWVLR